MNLTIETSLETLAIPIC